MHTHDAQIRLDDKALAQRRIQCLRRSQCVGFWSEVTTIIPINDHERRYRFNIFIQLLRHSQRHQQREIWPWMRTIAVEPNTRWRTRT